MHTVRASFTTVAVALTAAISTASAQNERASEFWLSVSPTLIDFQEFSGSVQATALHAGLGRRLGGVRVDVSVFAAVPAVEDYQDLGCPPGSKCPVVHVAGDLRGVTASASASLAHTGLRGSLGIGRMMGTGGTGPGHRSAVVGVAGLSWTLRQSAPIRPVLSVRGLLASRRVFGARTVLLPGIGVAF